MSFLLNPFRALTVAALCISLGLLAACKEDRPASCDDGNPLNAQRADCQ